MWWGPQWPVGDHDWDGWMNQLRGMVGNRKGRRPSEVGTLSESPVLLVPKAYQESQGLKAAARRILYHRLKRDALTVGVNAPNTNDYNIFGHCTDGEKEEIVQLTLKSVRGKRAMGSMVGMAVADSVGAPLEFLPVGAEGSHFDPKTMKHVGQYNKFNLKPGQWTDDTSMGLCLADSLLVRGGYSGSDIRVRFWNWWYRGYNNAFRKEPKRSQSVGLGGNISASLFEISDASPPPRVEAIGDESGNGSLMRLAPVPIYFHKDFKLAMKMAAEQSYTTHPGPTAASACAFLAFLIARAVTRDQNYKETAAQFLDACVSDYVLLPEAMSESQLMRLLRSEEPEDSTERCWNWRDPAGPFLLETLHNRGPEYNGYPVSADYFGSYSMDGLAMALHSMYHTKSFMEALTRCVNLLGDADSTGAILGQIAGAFYGFDAIDKRLIVRLNKWDDGEIALRGALLYVQGSELVIAEKEETKRKVFPRDISWNVLEAQLPVDEVPPASLQPSVPFRLELHKTLLRTPPDSARSSSDPPLPTPAIRPVVPSSASPVLLTNSCNTPASTKVPKSGKSFKSVDSSRSDNKSATWSPTKPEQKGASKSSNVNKSRKKTSSL